MAETPGSSGEIRATLLREAEARQGLPYQLDPPPDGINTIDCSLYVLKVAAAAGVPLPVGVRTAEQIRQATVPVAWSQVQPGDLLFFEGTYNAAGPAGPDGHIASHIGISLGAGTQRMWHSAEPVSGLADISGPYWQTRLFDARRLPQLAANEGSHNSPHILRGIDVASWQGEPDWQQVAAFGVAFAITKATQGVDYLNPTFARNWREIKAHGMVRGAYHYAEPHDSSPDAEAAYFVDQVNRLGIEPGDLLALDIEPTTKFPELGKWSLVWLDRVESATGIRPLVYTGRWIAERDDLARWTDLAEYPLWLAAYQSAPVPAAPAPWSSVAIWQHTDKGSVPGIRGNVDLNRFAGSRDELVALGKPVTVAPIVSADPRDDQISGLLTAVAHLADVVSMIEDPAERMAQAQSIREQFVGPKPAA